MQAVRTLLPGVMRNRYWKISNSMKRYFSIISSLSVIWSLTSLFGCVKEVADKGQEASWPVVYLSSDKPQFSADEETKTQWTGETIVWSKGDKVQVAAKGDGAWLSADGSAGVAGALVESASAPDSDCATTKFAVPSSFLKNAHESWQFYSVYPSSCVTSTSLDETGGIPVKIPQVQLPVCNGDVNSYDPSADLLVGKTAEIRNLESGGVYQMIWDRAVAHLNLNFTNLPDMNAGEELVSILIRTDQPLVNSFSLTTDGELVLPQTPGTDNVLTIMRHSGNMYLTSDASIRDVWVCVRPCTVNEITVEILTNQASYVKSWTGISRTFSRNRRNTMNVNMKGARRIATGSTSDTKSHRTVFDTSFDVDLPEKVLFTYHESASGSTLPYDVKMPAVSVRKAIDLHVEVLPLYVFGNSYKSGDYYSVSGYCVIHNAEFFKVEQKTNTRDHCITTHGRYMGEYKIDVQLLTSEGESVNSNNVSFLVTPEPSTTIGGTTYTKGSKFGFEAKYQMGPMQIEDATGAIQWSTLKIGFLGLVFSSDEVSSQELPDQSVTMMTGPYDRSVSYSLVTNNDGAGYVPAIARTDQRMDFSWVWHVNSGCYAAKDNDFGNMKIKIAVAPIFKTCITDSIGNLTGSYEEEGPKFTTGFDLPGLNRIPVGVVNLQNTSKYYISNILLYRSGEYGIKSPYYSHSGAYDTDQTASILMREGEYDIVFEKLDGSTRESKGRFIIRGVKVEADHSVSTSTMYAEEL